MTIKYTIQLVSEYGLVGNVGSLLPLIITSTCENMYIIPPTSGIDLPPFSEF